MKYDIIFTQVGTPKTDHPNDIKAFLRVFLESPRVIDLNQFLWKIILNLFILPRRPKKISKRYAAMINKYDGNRTFLLTESMFRHFTNLNSDSVKNHICYALDPESVSKVKSNLQSGSERIVVPLFPQHSEATYDLIYDHTLIPFQAKPVHGFLAPKEFAKASATKINRELKDKSIDCLFLTYHSYPVHRIKGGETYEDECIECFKSITDLLDSDLQQVAEMSYQSKFGKGEWLGPLIEDKIFEEIESGKKNFAVYSPSFLVDSIETSWELGMDLVERVESAGANLHFIECLNDDPKWLDVLHTKLIEKIN